MREPVTLNTNLNTIGTTRVWLKLLLSACLDFFNPNKQQTGISTLLNLRNGKNSAQQDQCRLELNKQTKLGIVIRKLVGLDTKNQSSSIAPTGQLCANTSLILVKRALGKCSYLPGLVLLTAIMLFHPISGMQVVAGIGEQSDLSVGGYDNNLATQGINEYDSGLYNLENPTMDGNLGDLSTTPSEIKINPSSDPPSPTINSQKPIQLAQAGPTITLFGAGTTNSFTESDFSNPATVTEGNSGPLTVYFLMSVPPTATNNFIVNYSIAERAGEDFLASKTEDRMLNLATSGVTSTNSGKRYIKGSFEIANDQIHEVNGLITLTLKSGNSYSLPSAKTITINVTDNDNSSSPPLVSLAGVSKHSGFRFQLSSTDPNGDGIVKTLNISENMTNAQVEFYYYIFIPQGGMEENVFVNFEFTQQTNDNFLGDQMSIYYPRVELSSYHSTEKQTNNNRQYFRGNLYIESDSVHEEDGVLTFSIKSGSGYAISSNVADTKATINVTDNDSTSGKPLVTFVGVGGTASFMESSFSRNHTVTEGDTNTTAVYFMMYIPQTAGTNFAINFTLNQGSNSFLVPNQSTSFTAGSVNFNPSNGRRYLVDSFTIANDTVDEANGEITFTINDGGSDYAISSVVANRSATITVEDNDKPKISITRGSAIATEGTDSEVSFTLSATPTPYQNLTISVMVSESGDVISTGGKGTRMITMTAGASSKMDTVSIANDGKDEANSTITITVTACTGVTVADDCVVETNSTPNDPSNPTNTASIVVADDEVPKISITGPASRDDVDGSNNANTVTFTLEANPIPHRTINIKVNLTQVPNMNGQELYVGADTMGEQTRTVEMLATNTKTGDTTRGSKTFDVMLANSSGGDITATVALNTADPNKYALADSGTAHTTSIIDLNSMPNGPVIEFINFTTTANVATTSIAEGESFKAKFRAAAGNTVSTALIVDLRVTQSGNFYSGAQSITANIATSGSGETSSIATVEDTEDEADGSITVTLIQGTRTPANKNYRISSDTTKVAKSITVTDNDTPEVSISRTGGSITEGDTSETNVPFRISATPPPYQTITVNLTITETGDVLSGATNKTKEIMVMLETSGTANDNVTIVNDTNNEADSTITVQVSTGTGYVPVSNSTDTAMPINKIEFIVEDNDLPQVKISRVSKTPNMQDFNVNEEDLTASYKLVATPAPYQTIIIKITVTQTGNVIKGAIPQSIDLTTTGMETGIINLDDDDVDEADSEITIQVTSGTGYAPVSNSMANETTTNTITIAVADNDVPRISVSSAGSVSEDEDAVFTLTSNIRPLNELTIRVDLSSEPTDPNHLLYVGAQSGLQSGMQTRLITMMPSEFEGKNFTVDLCNGTFSQSPCTMNEDPSGGHITATVKTNSGFEYDPDPAEGASSHRILIIDPETPPAGPIIELVAVTSSSVVEGTALNFNFVIESGMTIPDLTPDSINPERLEVNLSITQVGDYLGTHEDTVDVFTGGSNSISLPTNEDSVDEADGSITVEIVTGIPQIANKRYQISTDPTKYKQTISVNDNDVPAVSITRDIDSIAEDAADSKFTYTLTSDPVPYQAISVEVSITKTGGNILAPNQTTTINMSTSGIVKGEVNILDNNDNEADGVVTISVISGTDTGYAPVSHSTPNDTSTKTNTITVTVIDDDIPEISISGKSSVSEDDDAVFTLVADPTPRGDITINVQITQTPNVSGQRLYTTATSTGPRTLNVMMLTTDNPRGSKTLTLNLSDAGGGSITATVLTHSSGNYVPQTAGNAHTHTIHVSDPDSPATGPVIELVALTNTTITEGDSVVFEFRVEAGSTVRDALELNLSIGGEGKFIDGTPAETVDISTKDDPDGVGGTGSITIQTDDDEVNEASGTITVEILSGSANPTEKNYRISSDPAKVSQTVTVLDNDNSVITISQVETTATERDTINYRLTANPAPAEEIQIAVEIEETGNVLAETQVKLISMPTSGTALGTVNLDDDNIDEDESTITVRVIAGIGYTPASGTTPNANDSNTITIVVSDNDVPQISVTGDGSVSETDPEGAVFKLMANPAPWEDITINVSITQSPYVPGQNLFSGNATRTVEMSAITTPLGQATLTVDLNSGDNTSGGTIIVSVTATLDGKYDPAEFGFSHTTQITDPQSEPEQTAPVIELVAVSSTPIVEGNPAVFNFQAGSGSTVSTELSVDLSVTQTGDFVGTLPNSISITSATAILSIDTIDDETSEVDGSITVTIFQGRSTQDNKNYRISSDPAKVSQTIMIKDDDLFISISPGQNQTEGSPVSFEFTSSENFPVSGVRISIRVDQSDSFMKWRAPRSFTMTSNPDTLVIQTIIDESLVGNGSITVTLIDQPGSYKINPGRNDAVVTITKTESRPPAKVSTRISIAHTAVDEILSFLNPRQVSSPPITNTESSSVIVSPEVSITAVDDQVDEGTTARFLITSSNGTESTRISVSFQVEQVQVQVVLPSSTEIQIGGQDTVSIAIPTINDNHANEDGYVAVSLLEDPDYQISENAGRAVVNISDAVDRQNRVAELTTNVQAFIPDLTGTMGANSLATVLNRIELGLSENNQQILELWGRNSIPGILTASGDSVNENTTTLKSFLGDSSFAMTLNSGDEFAIPTTLWGLGDYQNISPTGRNRDSISWSGDLFTGHIGIDALIQEGLLAGISASVAESDVEFESTLANEIQFNSRTTSLNPYIGWTSKDQNSELQATFGMGLGELEIKQDSYDNEVLDSQSYSIGLTGNQVLFTSDHIFAGTTRLSIKGDSWFAYRHIAGRDDILADFHTNTHHVRIRTESTHQFGFTTGSTLSPTISVGMRNDVKDQQSVLGLEIISGANYTNPIGLTVAGNGSMLIGPENQIQKIKIESSLTYDYGVDQRGLIAEVAPSWGQIDASIQNTLWDSNSLDSDFEHGRYSNGTSLTSELGYGFEILQGESTLTPISGFAVSTDQDYEYLLGTRLGLGPNTNIELLGIQEYNTAGNTTTSVHLNGKLNW